MRLDTKAYGEIEIDEIQIIEFPEGIMGFPEYNKFALIDSAKTSETQAESPFKWLQSLDDKNLAFIIIDPALFYENYLPKCSPDELKKIEIQDIKNAVILAIVTIPEDPSKMTANLQGPILINKKNQLAIQTISVDDKHLVRQPIIEKMNERLQNREEGNKC